MGSWHALQERHREAAKEEEKRRRGVTRDELVAPTPWRPSNQPMARVADVATAHARAEAAAAATQDRAAKDGGAGTPRRIKPNLPPRKPGGGG